MEQQSLIEILGTTLKKFITKEIHRQTAMLRGSALEDDAINISDDEIDICSPKDLPMVPAGMVAGQGQINKQL